MAAHFPAVVLTGARQTGKTTLLRELFPDHTYVSLDLPADASLAEDDPDAFLRRYRAPVLVDEVQYAPRLFRHLKAVIDHEARIGTDHPSGRYVLTGSQKLTLMREVSDSLAGRAGLLELETLSAAELGEDFVLARRNGTAKILARGFFPGLWKDPDMPRSDFYRSYLATYIERDVRQLLNIASLRDFDRFMRVAATRTGQLLNKTDVAKDVGVSPKTISDWLSVLQASNQILLIEPFHQNLGKRVVKTPKLYFADPGLAAFLLGLNETTLAASPHLGPLWETFVYGELRKELSFDKVEATLWFYRDQQIEVDFVISYGGRLHLADAKAKATATPRDFDALTKLRAIQPSAVAVTSLIGTSDHTYPVDPERRVLSGFELHRFVTEL